MLTPSVSSCQAADLGTYAAQACRPCDLETRLSTYWNVQPIPMSIQAAAPRLLRVVAETTQPYGPLLESKAMHTLQVCYQLKVSPVPQLGCTNKHLLARRSTWQMPVRWTQSILLCSIEPLGNRLGQSTSLVTRGPTLYADFFVGTMQSSSGGEMRCLAEALSAKVCSQIRQIHMACSTIV